MNRRGFLRSLFASTATIVIAPACVLDELPPVAEIDPHRVYFDMGKARDPVEIACEEMINAIWAGPIIGASVWEVWKISRQVHGYVQP